MATRCFMPPESWWGRRSSKPARPVSSSMRRAARSRSTFATRRSLSGNATFSTAESQGRRLASWKIMPTLRGIGAVMGSPSQSTVPLDGSRSPATSESRVDLPQPLGPTTATNWPSGISRLIESSATTPAPSAPKRWETPRIATRARVTRAAATRRAGSRPRAAPR